MKKVNLAVVGATGMVGRTFLEVLEEKNFPINQFYPFASKRSAGQKVIFKETEYTVEELTPQSFDRGIDIALFSAGGGISLVYAPIAAKAGCVVIDNSSAWRMDKEVPLVVPEVNPNDVTWNKGIIANPNCSTIQAMVALKPLAEKYGLKRVVYSTYQAVSGAGLAGWKDLEDGVKSSVAPKKFPKPIAFNVLPHIDVFEDNGYTKEEMKMVHETRKILHLYNLPITATTVRVPVYSGHSESINVELNSDFDLKEIVELLKNSPGIVVMDDVKNNVYPTVMDAVGKDEVFIGRIRRDESIKNGINMWVVADNLRKGAASNAVQIAELLIQDN